MVKCRPTKYIAISSQFKLFQLLFVKKHIMILILFSNFYELLNEKKSNILYKFKVVTLFGNESAMSRSEMK